MEIHIKVNDEDLIVDSKPSESLLDMLRRIGFKSVKKGCGQGDCGACTVLVDGKAVASCILLAAQCRDKNIVTIEGLGTPTDPHPLQKAFVDVGAVQCGYCTPGMILAAKSLLDSNPSPSDDEIKEALDGVKCRCTGYVKQIAAVKKAAELMNGGEG